MAGRRSGPLLWLLVLFVAAVERRGTSAVPTHTVTIERMQFTPARLLVRQGDTVEWVNADVVPHTATSRNGRFDSRTIAAGSSWRWTAGAPGSASYTCSLHPGMSGQLEVR